eukprot:1340153-Amphidinium_carterae.1
MDEDNQVVETINCASTTIEMGGPRSFVYILEKFDGGGTVDSSEFNAVLDWRTAAVCPLSPGCLNVTCVSLHMSMPRAA